MKQSHNAIALLIDVVTELADIARDMDPGRVVTYARIEKKLEAAREALTQARAFEHS